LTFTTDGISLYLVITIYVLSMEFNRRIIEFFELWRNKKERKPLIVRGARQVGKTSAILLFAKKHFDNLVYINLEKAEHGRLFNRELSLSEFKQIINVHFGKTLIPGQTLLFIDEIQESPYLLKLLRFFYEDMPGLHVISAGSLFEVKIKEAGIALPVGRIEFAHLFPLDFFEFLEAIGEIDSLKFLNNFDFAGKIPAALHDKFLKLFYEYVLIGGMPEAVKIYAQTKNVQAVNLVYSNLLTSLKEDIYKYSSASSGKYLSFVLDQAPLFAGQSVTYEKFAGSNYKSREIHKSFDTLSLALIINQIKATKSFTLPLIPQQKKAPKLVFLDVGLVNYQMGIQKEFINLSDLNALYQGRIAEQVVGQQLLASFVQVPAKIYYWYKKYPSEAEVDFCLSGQSQIIGIEVKSGSSGRLKSAYQFMKTVKNSRALRIYSGEFKATDKFISLPFYLLPRWQEI